MPKLGMEPIRRAALVKATIEEIGAQGSLDVTVGQIARRAGMSSALAHHYFGGKEQIFLAAMRHILSTYSAEVRGALSMATDPRSRVEAVIRAGFSTSNFRPEVVAAWLNFYVLAQTSPDAARLLSIYYARLRSNLCHGLRPLVGDRAPEIAGRIGAMIDGLYLRQGLGQGLPSGEGTIGQVVHLLDLELGAAQS
ncbi:transcriptional regulator BetI [Ponticoccus sp. SC2-23]|uniref:choline-binding transcriptional repressor BetI n=1 Tax=Alexandriicola marinus TaxID=2081710 RepID=UPI000FD732B6|nr:transcriptional regulator BetI [Alexandriicola marinus]MBM1219689.1 transcriptional regulator BetI [Ponticoccus sp. SC6-9]MBM1223239.1 transcriptional regulator BetI [Ponticoccus sp. SC6-15]MBM1229502.1 transcriptional regulator BetI [Ponticoccus sp. SC6-38]MBM1232205.1 transcriptional regulator BetI [Ponticoccus sp. SC6-45]MBM1237845.1 transcriptional regulator BetI [Ponticoccus sp. SC6-49]MBM1241216.1 transcriptional regulator BetI [Ponticoccus sp. SC2-64]MBM1245729.1 transcriptional re